MLKTHIESAMIDHSVPDRLAARMAFQLVLKCPANQLGDAAVWNAIGRQVRDEMDRLRQRLGLTDRLLTVGVPKLSADDIERLFDEMRSVDARYGRTLAEAALDGAEPWAMARRYGKAFTEAVVRPMATAAPSRCPVGLNCADAQVLRAPFTITCALLACYLDRHNQAVPWERAGVRLRIVAGIHRRRPRSAQLNN